MVLPTLKLPLRLYQFPWNLLGKDQSIGPGVWGSFNIQCEDGFTLG